MSGYNTQSANSQCAVIGIIEPVAGATTYTTGYILASQAYQYMAIISAGTVGTSVDAKIRQAVDSSGTSVKDLSGSAITQLTAAGTAIIQFRANQLDVAGGFDYIVLSITTVGATSVVSGQLIGVCGSYEPMSNVSTVDEVVTVA